MAHAYIDAIADSGADAVKFQTHIAVEESTLAEPWREEFSRQDETRFDYWRRMEFSPEQWAGLKCHAKEKRLLFLSSPFSLAAVELLEKVGVVAWKIASGEVTNVPLIDAVGRSGLPVLLSTGMSDLSEIDVAAARVKALGAPLAVLQCASVYPSPPESVGLNLLATFRDRYACAVGLSDHSGTIFPGLAAATVGAEVLEVHVTLCRNMFGPDVTASVTTAELSQLVTGIRFIERMRAHPVDKTRLPANEMRKIFMKSIVARANLTVGTVLTPENIALKKAGAGLPASALDSLYRRRLRRDVARDVPIMLDDLDPHQS